MDVTHEAVLVQIGALIDSWQQQKAERLDLADGMATDGNRAYQQGYAHALDSCLQSLRLLRDA